MRNARRYYNADVVVATMIITIDKESHYPPGEPRADVAQDDLSATLQKKHHVPLLVVVATQ